MNNAKRNIRSLNYKHLHYFWVVATEGSIARAAEVLFLTPQTISGQLSEFEQAIGEALLIKRGRGLELTETGHLVRQYADDIFDKGKELIEVLNGRLPEGTTKLRIGIVDAIPKLIAYRILETAYRLADTVRIVCSEGKLEELLAELSIHRIDMILANSPLPTKIHVRAYNHLLGDSGMSLFARRSSARQYRRDFPYSLDGVPMLMPTENTPLRRTLEQWFEDLAIAPVIAGEFEDSALMKTFGQAGVGVFWAPSVIESEIRRQYAVDLIGRIDEVRETYYALSAERKVTHPAVSAITHVANNTLFTEKQRRTRRRSQSKGER